MYYGPGAAAAGAASAPAPIPQAAAPQAAAPQAAAPQAAPQAAAPQAAVHRVPMPPSLQLPNLDEKWLADHTINDWWAVWLRVWSLYDVTEFQLGTMVLNRLELPGLRDRT